MRATHRHELAKLRAEFAEKERKDTEGESRYDDDEERRKAGRRLSERRKSGAAGGEVTQQV